MKAINQSQKKQNKTNSKYNKLNDVRNKLLRVSFAELNKSLKVSSVMFNSEIPEFNAKKFKTYNSIKPNYGTRSIQHQVFDEYITNIILKETLEFELILNMIPDKQTSLAIEKIKLKSNFHRKSLYPFLKLNSHLNVVDIKERCNLKDIKQEIDSPTQLKRNEKSKSSLDTKSIKVKDLYLSKDNERLENKELMIRKSVYNNSNLSTEQKLYLAENIFLTKEEQKEREIQKNFNRLKIIVFKLKILKQAFSEEYPGNNQQPINNYNIDDDVNYSIIGDSKNLVNLEYNKDISIHETDSPTPVKEITSINDLTKMIIINKLKLLKFNFDESGLINILSGSNADFLLASHKISGHFPNLFTEKLKLSSEITNENKNNLKETKESGNINKKESKTKLASILSEDLNFSYYNSENNENLNENNNENKSIQRDLKQSSPIILCNKIGSRLGSKLSNDINFSYYDMSLLPGPQNTARSENTEDKFNSIISERKHNYDSNISNNHKRNLSAKVNFSSSKKPISEHNSEYNMDYVSLISSEISINSFAFETNHKEQNKSKLVTFKSENDFDLVDSMSRKSIISKSDRDVYLTNNSVISHDLTLNGII